MYRFTARDIGLHPLHLVRVRAWQRHWTGLHIGVLRLVK